MPKRLTDAQQAAYQRDGFVAPIDIFTDDEVEQIHAELDAAEAAHGDQLQATGRNNAHYVLPVLDRIAHDQRILDAVEDVIGPDILVAGTTLFIKEPETTGFISWHQDARYIGLEPHDWVTAWLAISDVNEENGCMRMVPGTHAAPLVDHVDTFGEDNMLTRGQTIMDIDETRAVDIELRTGEAALFDYSIAHASPPNQTDDRRIAVVLRYIPPETKQLLADWDSAALVRGEDRYGNFEHEPEPAQDLDPVAVAFHRKAEEMQRQVYYKDTEWQDDRVSAEGVESPY